MHAYLLLLSVAATIAPAFAQTSSSCNPLKGSCPANPALAKAAFYDFTQGLPDDFTVSTGAAPTFDDGGARFSIAKHGDAPTLASKWYMMFGHYDVVMQAAPGTGVVSSLVLLSDDLDEVDWEWLGAVNTNVQSNYFGKGNTSVYDREMNLTNSGSQDGFHTYSVDWTSEQITWSIDGQVLRTLTPDTADYNQYPQTPMQLKLGNWAAGDPAEPQGTISWAGGEIDYTQGPFVMTVKSVKAIDYSTGNSYSYGDKSGAWESIKSNGGTIQGAVDPSASASTVMAATSTAVSSIGLSSSVPLSTTGATVTSMSGSSATTTMVTSVNSGSTSPFTASPSAAATSGSSVTPGNAASGLRPVAVGGSLFSILLAMLFMENFENIYLDLQKTSGRCRLAESGLGWKSSGTSEPFTLDGSQLGGAQWSRAAKGFELKIMTRDSDVIQLDGFEQDDFDRVAKAFKIWYSINLENKEHALKGWNWGKAEFGRAELAFNVQNRPAFEIPYSEISNTNLAGKNEIAVEFNLGSEPTTNTTNGTNGQKAGHTKNRGKKAAAASDELVEMRFYIPGTVSKKEVNGSDAGSGAEGEGDDEEQNAANLFYETLIDKAEIGDVAGTTFATFQDVLHLTPRGRFDIDMYENSFRLRGKTYDYKIQYQAIKKFFILPKIDEIHTMIVLGLDPPLRQGQTRYPFVVMQLKLDEEVTLDLNMTEELLETKYKDKLDVHYEAPIHHVIAKVFKGLSGKKIIMPSKDFVSHHNMNGVKCSIKANEGSLYCLDKSFMFVPKPATYVQIESIANITMSRVGGALAASRTFDITMTLKSGQGEYQFSNINREEQRSLEDFFKAKNIRFKNEMTDDSSTLLKAALENEDLATSEDDADAAAVRGSADEDDETPDEDFQADSDSDVAEEFDSNAASSGSEAGSDAEGDVDMDEVDAAEGSEDEEDRRPKKKTKTKG